MERLENGLHFKCDELKELVGADNFDFIKGIENVISTPNGEHDFIFFYKDEAFYLNSIKGYINNKSLNLEQSGPLYQLCYLLNHKRRGINYNLLNYYLITGELIKAIPHALELAESYRAEKNVYNDNGLYVCIFYDIIEYMIRSGLISKGKLSSEDIESMERIKAFIDQFRETMLISLLEGNLHSNDVRITDDKISAIVELTLNRNYSLAYFLSQSLGYENNLFSLKRFLAFYHHYVFGTIKESSRRKNTNTELWMVILSKRYRVLKEIYSAPNIARYLSNGAQYKQKIDPMKKIIEELLKLESMTKEEILAYAEETSHQEGESEELYDMILNGEFIRAYKQLSQSDDNKNKKMRFLLEMIYDAVMGNVMDPLNPSHALVLQSMANIKQLNQ